MDIETRSITLCESQAASSASASTRKNHHKFTGNLLKNDVIDLHVVEKKKI